jgi:hypothetical protein
MGLDAGFLQMLTASVTHESVHVQPDLWGNDLYDAPVTRKCFIESVKGTFGQGRDGSEQESRESQTMSLICDAVGMKIGDRITHSGTPFWVRSVDTYKDETGLDLYQEVEATDQKE